MTHPRRSRVQKKESANVLTSKRLGFIGGGNMAEAMIRGLLSAAFISAKNLLVSDVSSLRTEFLHSEYKVRVAPDNRELTDKSDIVILAVKPQIAKKVLEEIHDRVDQKKLLISVAAGVPIAIMEDVLRGGQDKTVCVVRTMPNTPALVQEGVTAIAPGSNVGKNDIKIAHRIFEAIGRTVDVEEGQLDAVTGLSGSGPAYIFMIIEALSDAGVKMGLSRDVANILTIQTVLGSAKLARESGKHPGELKDMVTSPGGTSISGLHTLEAGGLRTTLMDAVEKATLRSAELGRHALNNQDWKSEEE
ncbi:MAG: pyrroline-5-carboxylate reductase [Nitrospinaceae bacterium]|nr:pyrroline-5-carboxylate reductase [Nitrospinaceae bacterium]NIR56947.1 pyrroline-5-carboxylate reductase [Nitrospinaceae bacterium]NIS87403.1 pyrroline-5-carboxylate reductase [Nitrospinaceae bacterium]NIT84255.1 pyrroline-5-carboxylate reductase [Nitrospinaceae bacterium]NIU46443.1 pyrroline-5-carboxylate reductase [Nitrospinaceae bacterium]